MDNNEANWNVVVCSAAIKIVLDKVPTFAKTWFNQICHIPAHIFVVDRNGIPLDSKQPNGYWYCAGDFRDIDEPGVTQCLLKTDIERSKCLVAPDIKDDHPDRESLVIAGKYNHNYVCHNIVNRILYTSGGTKTIADLDIPAPGYEFVVKSPLGVYGQNLVEWCARIEGCSPRFTNARLIEGSRAAEVEKIHFRAASGNRSKATKISSALVEIDNEYYCEILSILANQYITVCKVETKHLAFMEELVRIVSNDKKISFRDIVGGDDNQLIGHFIRFVENNKRDYFGSFLDEICSHNHWGIGHRSQLRTTGGRHTGKLQVPWTDFVWIKRYLCLLYDEGLQYKRKTFCAKRR